LLKFLVQDSWACATVTPVNVSASQLWSAGVWRTKLRSTWASTALQLLPSAADIYDQPTSISWLYRAVGGLHWPSDFLCCRPDGLTEFRSLSVGFGDFRRTLKTILFAR